LAEIRAIAQGKTGSRSRSEEDSPLVTEEDIAHIVASWTGVPVNTESESEKLLHEDTYINDQLVKKKQSKRFQSNCRARVGLKN